tara:strand:- start:95 stop:322 length:228 start_codon:yes stop_codon:yes gene_type:complete
MAAKLFCTLEAVMYQAMGEKQYSADCLIKIYLKIIFFEKSGKIYLIFKLSNLATLSEKIRGNIQFKSKNIIKLFN